jgi:hypothetical protein
MLAPSEVYTKLKIKKPLAIECQGLFESEIILFYV